MATKEASERFKEYIWLNKTIRFEYMWGKKIKN
jgi:hypothetical protein